MASRPTAQLRNRACSLKMQVTRQLILLVHTETQKTKRTSNSSTGSRVPGVNVSAGSRSPRGLPEWRPEWQREEKAPAARLECASRQEHVRASTKRPSRNTVFYGQRRKARAAPPPSNGQHALRDPTERITQRLSPTDEEIVKRRRRKNAATALGGDTQRRQRANLPANCLHDSG